MDIAYNSGIYTDLFDVYTNLKFDSICSDFKLVHMMP